MAITIQKEDKRPSVALHINIPAVLNDDLAAWAAMVDSSVKHTVIEILREACAQNRKDIDKWKADNKNALDTTLKPQKVRQNLDGNRQKSATEAA